MLKLPDRTTLTQATSSFVVAPEVSRRLPEVLPGFDPTRPIVASFLDSVGSFEALGLAAAQFLTDPNPTLEPQAMLHRVVLPAIDSSALHSAIVVALKDGGMRGAGDTWGNDQLVVSVRAAGQWVTVTILVGERLASVTTQYIRARPSALPTPADSLFASSEVSVVRLQLRSNRAKRAGMLYEMLSLWREMQETEPQSRYSQFHFLLRQVLAVPHVINPGRTSSTDTIVEVPASNPRSIHAAAVLTQSGYSSFRADPRLAFQEPTTARELAVFRVINVMGTSYPNENSYDFSHLTFLCGWSCSAYNLGPNGLLLFRRDTVEELRELVETLLKPNVYATILLTDSLVVLEGLAPSKTRFRDAKLPPPTKVVQSKGADCYDSVLLSLFQMAGTIEPDRISEIFTSDADTICAQKDPEFEARIRQLMDTLSELATFYATVQSDAKLPKGR